MIIASFFTVYNALGYGFLESVYRRALAREIASRDLAVAEEVPVQAAYEGVSVGAFRLDMLVNSRVVLEVKATPVLGPTDKRQLVNYLRATTLDVGLLLHFGLTPKFYRVHSPRILGLMRKYPYDPPGSC